MDEGHPPQFGPVILALLKERGWEQQELAAKIGRHPSQVSAWLNGRKPQRSNLIEIARAFGLSLAHLEALAAGREPPPPRLAGPAPTVATLPTDPPEVFRVPLVNSISAGPTSDSPELATTGAAANDSLVHVELKQLDHTSDLSPGGLIVMKPRRYPDEEKWDGFGCTPPAP